MEDKKKALRVDHVETQLIYLMQQAIYLFIRDIDRRLGMLYRTGKFNKEKDKQFKQLGMKIKELYFLEEKFDRDLEMVTNGRPGEYQLYQEESNEIARLMLLYVEKCAESQENRDALFSFLRNLGDGYGIIQEKDIERFYLTK